MPSAFSVPQEIIDQFLRFGSNTADSRMNIVSEFSKGKPISVLVPFLRTQYHGGYGIEADGVQYSAWYADEGIRISAGKAARYANSHVLISWETAAQRIEELLLEGTFATNLEVVEAPTHEREQLASSLWNMVWPGKTAISPSWQRLGMAFIQRQSRRLQLRWGIPFAGMH